MNTRKKLNEYGLVEIASNGDITYKTDFVNLKDRFANISLSYTTEQSISNDTLYYCNATKITDVYSDFGVKNFSIAAQPSEIANLIKYGVNGSNVGSILTDYTFSTTFNYTIYDTDNNTVAATISYASSNTINYLNQAVATASATVTSSSSATASSSSSKSKNEAAGVKATSFGTGIFTFLISALFL
ncbi:hypothetical protein KAFR_0B03260 [Kazachstania africana CBS 2517]|uniref:Uncharacterized protein n=1 Tax=Kazachstania africana (strain ATCC 22294 / BCRC 22015 / CBS 2517 / CECT 1963 / NBRC 1671 / NRRL Y-8276) TaxID=1071382 RepID=H2AQH2_KAZAF|nr:hypothetical protein KAFR_0B03260 [Kazachstania africana CBS 2517]CCF56622.1 hypothetical protein KAFR_0B03260 [Kazachstania africana CBS 2517]